MKRLLFVISAIFVTLAAAATCPDGNSQDKKNPFGPLREDKSPKAARAGTGDRTSSTLESEGPVITDVLNPNFANAKDIEKPSVHLCLATEGWE